MAVNDDELRFSREQRERALALLGTSPGSTQADVVRRKQAAELYDTVITPPVDADYRTPEHFSKTVSPKARGELADLLGGLRAFRSQVVGLPLGDAQVLYNGDGYALLLWEEFDRWITAHVRARLSKPSPRDQGNPLLTYARVDEEFGRWLEALVLAPGTGHMVPLSRLHKKLSWELYRATWSRFVVRDQIGLVLGLNTGHPFLDAELTSVLNANNWHREGLIATMTTWLPAFTVNSDARAIADELRTMTEDLVEVRGLLARSFMPSGNVLELAPGVFAGWSWEVGHLAGTVNLGTARDDVAQQLDTGTSNYAFSLDLAGSPRETSTPWLELGPNVSAWALGVVRPIHAHLLGLWDAAHRPVPGDDGDADEGEVIAAACEALALADVEVEETESGKARARVPAVRTVTLLALLKRVFGVEVNQGKGSEITVYRAGGRKYTLGHHKRNVHFPSHIVRAMLRALGIEAAEFRAAVGR
jgi:hypothetical protein